jgi:hypothetical protein
MKTTFTHLMATAAIVLAPSFCTAQTENPRGVYKLITLTDKYGNPIKEPFDQYKICTDSVTLMFTVQGNRFSLGKNDKTLHNYTGEEPDALDAHASRIFNSNAEHFTLKWWSTYPNHLYFPNNDWCTEYYESGKYSENAKLVLDALMSPTPSDPKNPLVGTWQAIGMMDELRDVKKELKRIHEEIENHPMNHHTYLIYTPTHAVASNGTSGVVNNFKPIDKKSFKVGNETHRITWLSKDCIAVEVHPQDYRTDYQILQRVTDSTPLFNKIASRYVIH